MRLPSPNTSYHHGQEVNEIQIIWLKIILAPLSFNIQISQNHLSSRTEWSPSNYIITVKTSIMNISNSLRKKLFGYVSHQESERVLQAPISSLVLESSSYPLLSEGSNYPSFQGIACQSYMILSSWRRLIKSYNWHGCRLQSQVHPRWLVCQMTRSKLFPWSISS